MSFPTLHNEVAFNPANGPLDTAPVWTDIATDTETYQIVRGRQTEDDQAQTGTCTTVLLDTNRSYDPNNASGPHYGQLLPMRPNRIRITLDGVDYFVFYGWTDIQDGWVRTEQDAAAASVNLPSNDGFDVLANSRLFEQLADGGGGGGGVSGGIHWVGHYGAVTVSTYSGLDLVAEDTGTRIDKLLGRSSGGSPNLDTGMSPKWPTTWRALDAGLTTMQADTATNNATTDVLSMIRQAEVTEPGFFFISGAGKATFQNRHNRITAASQATFCDTPNLSGGRILYDSLTTRRTLLLDDIQVTRNGGVLQEAADANGLTNYLLRSKAYSTWHNADVDAWNHAQWLLSTKSTSIETLESITLVPGTDSTVWAQVLGRELGDRITVIRTPSGMGAAITQDYFIEQINLSIGPGPTASCTWRLSPSLISTYWLAGIVGSSEAGVTTKAVF